MDNTTLNVIETTTQYEGTLQPALITGQIVNAVLLGLSLYLSACVATYGWKTGSWKMHQATGMDRGRIYTICLVAMLSDVPRFLLGEIVFNVMEIPGATDHCETLMDVTIVAYFVAVFPKYFFLWYRQHTINSHPASIRLFTKKFMRIASYTVLVIMINILILVTIFYLTYSFTKSPLGCIFIAFDTTPPVTIATSGISRDYILALGFILIEIMLLGLFVYPLFQSYQSKRKLQRKATNPSEKIQKDSLTSLMKRSSIAATIVVITDITVMVIAIHTPPHLPAVFLMLLYNIRNSIHSICVLSSFTLYKQILTVFCTAGKLFQSSRMKEPDTVMYASEQFQTERIN